MIDANWRLRAACIEHDPELWHSRHLVDVVRAQGICKACPVAGECLEDALDMEARVISRQGQRPGSKKRVVASVLWGIRAGTLPAQRYRLLTGEEPPVTLLALTEPHARKPRKDRWDAQRAS